MANDPRTFATLVVAGTTASAACVRNGRVVDDPIVVASRGDQGAEHVIEHVIELVADLAARIACGEESVLVVAIPEPFDFEGGVSRIGHELATPEGVDLGSRLRERTGHDVIFVHDAAAVAVGMWIELGRPDGAFGVVTLDTGVGSCLLLDGEPIEGFGELRSSPYLDGTFEDTVSTRALGGEYASRTGDEVPVAEIPLRASRGDRSALASLHWYGHHLGVGVARYFHPYDPSVIAVAGRITGAWDHFVGPMTNSCLHHGGTARIVRSEDDHAALVGAAVLAERRLAQR